MNLEEMRQYKVRWIMRFSVPAIIAMLLSAVVTVTDGYFTGNYVGKDALAAVNLGLPIVYLMLSCGLMVGVGGSVIAGILNGGGQKEKCRQVFNQTAATAFLVSATVSLLLWIFFEAVKRFLGVNEGLVFYFTEYYRVMLFYYPVMVLNSVFSMFIRAEGKPQYGMAVTVIGVVVNVFLNAAFIRLGLGICGIALASVVSGLVSLTLSFLFFVRYARICRFAAF
ncbi:MAG: polysaccharide biosynthesis C-terminal domain-containing protein, partial [Lachnospiraceae bacterium]|nr:polysaccharide biosynthesis C-terminal domain-containing protein [Lachnospiraceae bacterium]